MGICQVLQLNHFSRPRPPHGPSWCGRASANLEILSCLSWLTNLNLGLMLHQLEQPVPLGPVSKSPTSKSCVRWAGGRAKGEGSMCFYLSLLSLQKPCHLDDQCLWIWIKVLSPCRFLMFSCRTGWPLAVLGAQTWKEAGWGVCESSSKGSRVKEEDSQSSDEFINRLKSSWQSWRYQQGLQTYSGGCCTSL